tara:strand:- start:451 stop:1083 length:633 start_codon:yes stop_codon:yes gene_type:complete
MVAKQWKKLICEQKVLLDDQKPYDTNSNYDMIQNRIQGAIKKDKSSLLHPLSFDTRDNDNIGCDAYDESEDWNNNYCIQVNQGSETCKPDIGPTASSAETCERHVSEKTCNESTGCVWRRPNLIDDYEELSAQIGTCPRDPPSPGTDGPQAFDPGECVGDNLRICNVDQGAEGSLYGDLGDASDIIGKNYTQLNNWCKNLDDPRPVVQLS